jgi:PAS domain-containing protein
MLTADGRTVWLRHVVSATPGQARRERVRGVLIDVTSRREAERRMEEAKHVADGIIENLPELFMFDWHGRPIRWNDDGEAD